MTIGSGISGQLGLAPESSRGVYVAPTRFHEYNTESLDMVKNTVQGGGIAAGRYGRLGSRRVVTTKAGSGSWDMEVANQKMGVLLAHLMGSTAIPVQQVATAAYLQTHVLGDNTGLSLSIQKGVPDAGGTVRPYTFRGAKIISGEFKCAVDEALIFTPEIDAMVGASEVESLAAASEPTGITPFHFGQMVVSLGTYSSEVSITGVRGVSVKIERPSATDRFYAGAAGVKAEQLPNDFPNVTVTLDTDFVTKADLADRFAADTATALKIDWIGPIIASTYNQRFSIRVPMVFADTGTPNVEGPDLVKPSFDLVGQLDGTNPLASVEYMSTDITL